MINLEFVKKIETTEQKAKEFFERNPSILEPDNLIKKAVRDGLFTSDIDWDLFKHLMRKYTLIGM